MTSLRAKYLARKPCFLARSGRGGVMVNTLNRRFSSIATDTTVLSCTTLREPHKDYSVANPLTGFRLAEKVASVNLIMWRNGISIRYRIAHLTRWVIPAPPQVLMLVCHVWTRLLDFQARWTPQSYCAHTYESSSMELYHNGTCRGSTTAQRFRHI